MWSVVWSHGVVVLVLAELLENHAGFCSLDLICLLLIIGGSRYAASEHERLNKPDLKHTTEWERKRENVWHLQASIRKLILYCSWSGIRDFFIIFKLKNLLSYQRWLFSLDLRCISSVVWPGLSPRSVRRMRNRSGRCLVFLYVWEDALKFWEGI